ncbi:Rubrerythrin [Peptoclostridium litorale DSM 5388]|uniref:Putative rubrerythrin n=1 Tax=Peptoclostridium litorale DSM 5388 TaxID=1121324 RepID=A0A069RCG5_PEPLI|nr:ferritin family protein [Peptoclostridium litorale]KDR94706.1 putative rubrerythrin [Peptoclostridium litorale DSM 5388]SIO32886.1 Rubrerythrin [Peptoclostridium litorale DSM 5388]
MKDALCVIKYAMQMKKNEQEFFSNFKSKVKNQNIRQLFESLEGLEKEHYEVLKAQYDSVEKENEFCSIDLSIEDEAKIYQKESLELENVSLEYDMSDIPILRMAYLIKNDFVEFYKNAAENLSDPNAKGILSTLSEWEKTHRDGLFQEYKDLMEHNWFEQKFYPF